MASNRRKSAAVVLALLGVAGLSLASASQLDVTSSTLQAGSDTVDQCDVDGVAVSYGYAYDATAKAYVATTVNVSDIDCTDPTAQIAVTLAGTSGAERTLAAATVTGPTYSAAIAPLSAADLANVAVVITEA